MKIRTHLKAGERACTSYKPEQEATIKTLNDGTTMKYLFERDCRTCADVPLGSNRRKDCTEWTLIDSTVIPTI